MRKAKGGRRTTMMQMLRNLQRDICGATALEYGFMLCLIVMAMIVGMTALGQETSGLWNNVASQVASATAQAAA